MDRIETLIVLHFFGFSQRFSDRGLTGVEDSGVDPALSVTDGYLAVGVAEQDVCAAGPGRGRHSIGVVAVPVPHQHTVVIPGVQLQQEKQQT